MRALIVCTCVAVMIAAALFVAKLEWPANQPKLEATAAVESNANAALKQLWTCGMHPQVILDHPGYCPICRMKLVPLKTDNGPSATGGSKKIAYWWDPMLGPSSISNHAGKSAMGMDLVPVFEDQTSAGPAVRIDPTVVQNMGVTTAPVIRAPLVVTVRAVGTLEVPQPAMHDVTLKVNGYVEKLYADTEGMPVAKGDVLFDLYSPDLQLTEQELIAAEQILKALDSNAGKAVRTDAENLVASAKQKLRLWDVADQDIDAIALATVAPKTVPFRSTTSGHVMDKAIVDGSSVQAGMKVMRIEDHGALWLDAEVYEDQIAYVKIGQEVKTIVDSYPDKTFTGKVTFIFPHLDHMLRTETVRTVLDNSDHQLKPGMYATAEIVTQAVDNAILVPREAVIDTGTQQIAFVMDPTSAGHFQPRNVRTGIVGDNDKVQIVEGLAPGDQVVTSGQFLMDVESRTTEAIEKLRGNSAAAASAGPTTELIHAATPEAGGKP